MTSLSKRYLYLNQTSPHCRKVRLALVEKSLDFEMKEENLWHLRDAFLRLNLAGTLPVLVENATGDIESDFANSKEGDESSNGGPAHDDRAKPETQATIVGSATILEYLDEAYPSIRLLPGTIAERAEARRIQSWFDEKFFEEVSGPLIFEKVESRKAGLGAPNMEEVRRALENILYHLEYIGYLIEDRQWLAGDQLSVGDLAAGAHLSLLDYLGDVPWHKCEPAKAWYMRIKSRPCFRPILAERIPGMPPSRHYANLDF